jgi:hypothetical protein
MLTSSLTALLFPSNLPLRQEQSIHEGREGARRGTPTAFIVCFAVLRVRRGQSSS